MHQPLYKDFLTGTYYLPWVRLHATKGYWDMISILKSYPKIKVTFTLSPSLLFQLEDIAKGDAKDIYLELSKKDADLLSEDDKVFLLYNFFVANVEKMIRPLARYHELLQKRGQVATKGGLKEKIDEFSAQDFRDLQVLFNLAWCGFTLKKEDSLIRALVEKGRDFSEGDKLRLLEKQREVISTLTTEYKRLQDIGQIEIAVSPYYHPILPILIGSREKEGFDFREDAEVQLKNAISFYRQIFKRRPSGLWPPECGVSQDILPLISGAGIRWIVTDEDILKKSIGKIEDRSDSVHRIYRISEAGKKINIFFRDKNLSNLIAFVYGNYGSTSYAVDDFIGHLEEIRGAARYLRGTNVVTIALDGENSWSDYDGGGEAFLNGIYERISELKGVRTTTFDRLLRKLPFPYKRRVANIIGGSWINHDFKVWIGTPEKNRAWRYLKETRQMLVRDNVTNHDAWEEIYIAEGSDWFWWCGYDFTSPQKDVFDFLFRMHLGNVYRILGKPIPDYLNEPIVDYVKEKEDRETIDSEPDYR